MPIRKSHASDHAASDHAALGINGRITRRDFLGSTLLASGAVLLGGMTPAELLAGRDEFTGYGGIGEYSTSNGNTLDVLEAGHTIREGVYEPLPKDIVDTGENFDCVIIGGGISGLAAALFFQRQAAPGMKWLILENHPIFGGEAKQNEFLVDGKRLIAHQGSAIYQIPYPQSFLAGFYDSIGLKTPKLTYQRWAGPQPEFPLSKTPYEAVGLQHGQYGFWFGGKFGQKPGMWLIDPIGKNLEGAPVSKETRLEWLRWLKGEPVEKTKFEHPKVDGDSISRYLDSITLEQHYMERFGLSRETVRTFLSPVEGGGSGLGPDALSAYSDYAFEMLHPLPEEDGGSDQMFPGGNTTIARLMLKSLITGAIDGPDSVQGVSGNKVNFSALDVPGTTAKIRLSSTAVHVQHDGDPGKANSVNIAYLKGGALYRVKARSVVMAGGGWTTKHIVKDLPETHRNAYAEFHRSPCMMANVAVRNWRFLYKMGMTGCRWFESIGNYMEVRKLALTGVNDSTIEPESPIVLSLKILYSYPGLSTEAQGNQGRAEMIGTSFRDYERQIREQFTEMFASAGFNAQRDIAGIILNRWGHAYLSPQPGFFFGRSGQPAAREVLRKSPFGRIAFANTDLAGAMDHRYSILEAQRAVGQLLDHVLD
ncbi:MAG TPA: NAD(P)-binding protein [Candidatus Eremiobacteraceae bacterium]|nr:NAD(P)-binding protein [Candidatus Eremiobacteraceae bacterium]